MAFGQIFQSPYTPQLIFPCPFVRNADGAAWAEEKKVIKKLEKLLLICFSVSQRLAGPFLFACNFCRPELRTLSAHSQCPSIQMDGQMSFGECQGNLLAPLVTSQPMERSAARACSTSTAAKIRSNYLAA